jgi:hypothetical protein
MDAQMKGTDWVTPCLPSRPLLSSAPFAHAQFLTFSSTVCRRHQRKHAISTSNCKPRPVVLLYTCSLFHSTCHHTSMSSDLIAPSERISPIPAHSQIQTVPQRPNQNQTESTRDTREQASLKFQKIYNKWTHEDASWCWAELGEP